MHGRLQNQMQVHHALVPKAVNSCIHMAQRASAGRSEASVAKAFDAASGHFGTLHGAVLAAGVIHHSHKTPLDDITVEEFDSTCAVNLRGSFLSIKHAAR